MDPGSTEVILGGKKALCNEVDPARKQLEEHGKSSMFTLDQVRERKRALKIGIGLTRREKNSVSVSCKRGKKKKPPPPDCKKRPGSQTGGEAGHSSKTRVGTAVPFEWEKKGNKTSLSHTINCLSGTGNEQVNAVAPTRGEGNEKRINSYGSGN